MLVGTDLKSINYVAVEVIRNNTITKIADVECGLYMGICYKKDSTNLVHKFLVLMVSEMSVRLYNLSEYNIITVDTVEKDTRYMTLFTKDAHDQLSAILLLKELTTSLIEDKRIYNNDINKELIDVDTYINYPKAILEANNITHEKNDSIYSKTSSAGHSTVFNNKNTTTTTTTTTTAEDKTPNVTCIKRKGKLPSKERLEIMIEKVKQLAEGKYDFKVLPILDCDIITKDLEEKKTTDSSLKRALLEEEEEIYTRTFGYPM